MHRLFDPLMAAAALDGAALDWKTALQELTAAAGQGAPQYVVVAAGPDHAKHFTAQAHVAGRVLGTGEGASKKHAEQVAAQVAAAVLAAEAGQAGAVTPPGPPGGGPGG